MVLAFMFFSVVVTRDPAGTGHASPPVAPPLRYVLCSSKTAFLPRWRAPPRCRIKSCDARLRKYSARGTRNAYRQRSRARRHGRVRRWPCSLCAVSYGRSKRHRRCNTKADDGNTGSAQSVDHNQRTAKGPSPDTGQRRDAIHRSASICRFGTLELTMRSPFEHKQS